MKYTLRQMEIFLATAHHQSITLAAKELAMSQSAASEALKTLEHQFEVQLFDRAGKTLRLNEQGALLRVQAEALIDQARELEVSFKAHSQIGALNVGATLSIGNYLAINIMTRFMREHPKAKVSLDVENTTAIANKVRNFQLDIGLIEGELSDAELTVLPWRSDRLMAFCSADHPLAKRTTLSEQDLTEIPWVLREPGSGTRQTFDWAMHNLLPKLHVALELQHTEAIKRAVEANLGIGCLSAITLNDAFKRGNLVPLEIPSRDFARQFYFILHKEKYRSHAIEQWLALCRHSDYLS